MPSAPTRKAGGGHRGVITGLKQVDRALKQLPDRVAKKVIRQAMRASMRPVKAAVVANAPVESGATKRAVKLRAAKSRKKGKIAIEVRIGAGDYQGDQYYAAFQEYGWRPGKRGGPRGAPVPGKHFMLHAFESTSASAKDAAISAILTGVEREVKASRVKG